VPTRNFLTTAPLYVAHVDKHRIDAGPPQYIVQIRLPTQRGPGGLLHGLSDYTLDRRIAEGWLTEARIASYNCLRQWSGTRWRPL
jgi:hypothetical protein